MNDTSVSEKVRAQFVGRREALDAFYLRFAYRHMKNGIYYCGGGGQGKTWVLQKIINDSQGDPIRVVTSIIDFFDTQNHSVRGLQATIKSRLQNPKVFEPYDEALKRLEGARSEPGTHPSTIASLEARADKVFIECCQEAIVGREVILLFDTFERVQQRYVGRWLRQEFLPQVGDLIVAIAGRPDPDPAQMPDNVVTYELKGLALEPFAALVRGRLPSVSDEMVESIWKRTDGAPLMAHLILDLHEPQRGRFIARLSQLGEDERVQDSPELQRWLVGQFADPPDNRNKVMWAMAYLRRRFDVPMLKHIVGNTSWFRPDDYEAIFNDLCQLIYVKEHPRQQSHLLHDEIQRVVAKYVLPDVGVWEEFRADLYDAVVNRYYPEAIETIEEAPPDRKSLADLDLARQLRAEQLGYIFDQDPDAGLEKYEAYRAEVEKKTQDYDFEELLWGEVREYLDDWEEERGYDICRKRGLWLHRHSLFQKAEGHYRQVLDRFKVKQVETQQALGFMLMRQGKISEAQAIFEASRSKVKEDDFETIAMIENNLGQAARRAGQWDQALEHYARSFHAAIIGRNPTGMANVYINRGYLYSAEGLYSEAKKQCERAIDILEPLPTSRENTQRAIYAWMNLGTVYRHSGDYPTAAQYYRKSLGLAQKGDDGEAICSALQHMGINEHLWGRVLRRERRELAEACEHQRQAWHHLVEALEMAQRSDWRNAIADGLNRLGKVCREIYRLQTVVSQMDEEVEGMPGLQQEVLAYQPPFEVEYEYDMLTVKQFADADWLEKAARLFEISALIADEVNDFHRALESWTETARLLEELGMEDTVPIVIRRIERTRGYDYQEALFGAMSELILANLDFKRQNLDRALEKYATAHSDLAEQSGYALYVLTDRLRDLEWRLLALPPDTALAWCDSLEEEWLRRSVLTRRPEMRDTLERIRFETIRRQMEQMDTF
jgi:tetratricopeptide (TPR) repeat protein